MAKIDRPFISPDFKPTPDRIENVLGAITPLFNNFLQTTSTYKQTWKFSKTSGWMLKVHDGKKALCYLIPIQMGFKVSLAIRENEIEAFLEDKSLEQLHKTIKETKKVQEGYPLYFDVTNQDIYQVVVNVIQKLISMR